MSLSSWDETQSSWSEDEPEKSTCEQNGACLARDGVLVVVFSVTFPNLLLPLYSSSMPSPPVAILCHEAL